MKIEYNEQSEVERVPVAFVDNDGDLWFRTTSEENLMDNLVFVINSETNEVFTCCNMEDFISRANSTEGDIYAVKRFYEGDSISISF